jgi:hypothetical protein
MNEAPIPIHHGTPSIPTSQLHQLIAQMPVDPTFKAKLTKELASTHHSSQIEKKEVERVFADIKRTHHNSSDIFHLDHLEKTINQRFGGLTSTGLRMPPTIASHF